MFRINGESWSIFLVSPTHPILATPDGNYALGCCDDIRKGIFINDMLNPYYMKKVLCHEIVHAAMYSYNVFLDHDEEEVIAEIIATYGEEIIDITNNLFKNLRK